MKRKASTFKQRKAEVDQHYQLVERGVWYWLEHVVHWHLLLFALIAVLTFAYLLFDKSAPSFAQTVIPADFQQNL